MKKIMLVLVALVSQNVFANITGEQICKKIKTMAENQILMVFDGVEEDRSVSQMLVFDINGESKLGQFFDNATVTNNMGDGTTLQNNIPYQFQQYTFGRLLTQFFGIPAPIEIEAEEIEIQPDGTVVRKSGKEIVPQYWLISGLCTKTSCTSPDGSKAGYHEWYMTTGADDAPIQSKDVFVFTFPSSAVLPKINCQ